MRHAPHCSSPLSSARILLVEDWLPLAVEMQHHLEEVGAEVVGPMKRLSRARQRAQEAELDAALLDIDLNGEKVYPLAYDLMARGVPMILMSGFDPKSTPADLQHVPFVAKPLDFSAVIDLLAKLIED